MSYSSLSRGEQKDSLEGCAETPGVGPLGEGLGHQPLTWTTLLSLGPISGPQLRPQPAINMNRWGELRVVESKCLPVPAEPLSQNPACVSAPTGPHACTLAAPVALVSPSLGR